MGATPGTSAEDSNANFSILLILIKRLFLDLHSIFDIQEAEKCELMVKARINTQAVHL